MPVIGQIDVSININGLIVPHTFIVLPSLFHDCLLGSDFLTQSRATVDFCSRNVIFFDGLTTLPLLSLRTSHNILRLAQKLTIPPRSEAISRVLIHRKFKPQPCIVEGLPSLQARQVAVARVLVNPSRTAHSVCRLLNPTNAPITLDAKTPVATVEPIDLNDVVNRNSLSKPPTSVNQTTRPKPSIPVSHDMKIKHLRDIGLPLGQEQMTWEQYEDLTSFLYENRDLFATSLKDLPGSDIVTHKIVTTTDTPIRQRQFRQPPHLAAEMDSQCQKLLDANIIAPSTSPYSSPAFLIKKKDQTYRFVLDYRKLNAITVPQFFPLPTLDTCLDMVGQEQPIFFSVCDQKSGYYSIKMDPDSVDKTSFSTRSGHWKFLRMPFGLCGAPSTYISALSKLLHKELNENALIYLDDVIFFTKTFDGHLKLLDSVFQKFRSAKLRLNPQKSFFCKPEVTYLGHKFNAQGISIDENRTKAVKTFPRPRNQRDLRGFLGILNYWRRFIPSYSTISSPLRELLLKDVPFKWTDRQEQAFKELKDRLCSSPILGYPNMNSPFIVTTDASKTALGYVLSQIDEKGQRRVIAYAGRSLKAHELRYSATDLEMAAVIQAITSWHPYLANQHFTIETDHISLKYLKDLKLGNSRLIRWSLLLSMYQYDIRHLPGKTNTLADCLSRRSYDKETDETPLMDVNPDTYLLAVKTKSPSRKRSALRKVPKQMTPKSPVMTVQGPEDVATSAETSSENDDQNDTTTEPLVSVDMPPTPVTLTNQRNDPFFAEIIDYLLDGLIPENKQRARRVLIQAENYTIDNDLLIHLGPNRSKRMSELAPLVHQVCVPPESREAVIEGYHTQLLHVGIDKTYMSIKRSFYWPQMYSQVRDHVMTCTTCQTIKTVPQQPRPPLHSLEPVGLFHRLHVDHLGPLIFPKGQDPAENAKKHKFQHVLVMIDAFSHNVELVPAVSTSASETAQLIYDHYITRYGVPEVIFSDRGQAFCSQLSEAFYKRCGIKHLKTSPRRPTGNSASETVNKTIIRALRATCTGSSTWVEQLPTIAMSLRASVSTSLGVSPFKVLYSQDMRLPIDTHLVPTLPQHVSAQNFLAGFEPQVELLRKLVAQNVKESRERSAETYNRTAAEPNYKVGDTVYLRNELVNRAKGPHKLQRAYLGPMVITEVGPRYTVKLQHLYTGKLGRSHVHMSKIKPARLNRHLLRQKYLPPPVTDIDPALVSPSDEEAPPHDSDPECSDTLISADRTVGLLTANLPSDAGPSRVHSNASVSSTSTNQTQRAELDAQSPVHSELFGPTVEPSRTSRAVQVQSPLLTPSVSEVRPATDPFPVDNSSGPTIQTVIRDRSSTHNNNSSGSKANTSASATDIGRPLNGPQPRHELTTAESDVQQSIAKIHQSVSDILDPSIHQQLLQDPERTPVFHDVTTTNDPSSLVATPPVVKLTGPAQQHDSSILRSRTPSVQTIELDQESSTVPPSTGVSDYCGPSYILADDPATVLGQNDVLAACPGPVLAAQTLPVTQLSPLAPDFLPPTRRLAEPDPFTPVPPAASLAQFQAPAATMAGKAALPPRLQQPSAQPNISSDSTLIQHHFTDICEPTRTRRRTLDSTATPQIIRKKMNKGKNLQFLVKYPSRPYTTWTSATQLPAAVVAEYMTKSYAAKQRKRSRRMAQFGQR